MNPDYQAYMECIGPYARQNMPSAGSSGGGHVVYQDGGLEVRKVENHSGDRVDIFARVLELEGVVHVTVVRRWRPLILWPGGYANSLRLSAFIGAMNYATEVLKQFIQEIHDKVAREKGSAALRDCSKTYERARQLPYDIQRSLDDSRVRFAATIPSSPPTFGQRIGWNGTPVPASISVVLDAERHGCSVVRGEAEFPIFATTFTALLRHALAELEVASTDSGASGH